MEQIVNQLISTILQLVAFTLIPFLVFLIRNKSTRGFFDYVGLKATTKKASYLALIVSLLFVAAGIGLALLNEEVKQVLINPPSVTGLLREMGPGVESLVLLILIAGFKTSLSEEIFFRGFIGKRLVVLLGYRMGNLLQAIVFAMVHVLLFWALSKAGFLFLVFIFIFSGTAGYLVGFIKEKHGNGSILPGWLAHGLGNTVAYFVIAFVI